MGGMGGFGQNFGRSAAAGQASGDVEAELTLNLEDAHRGGNMQMTLPNGRTVTVKLPAGVSEGKKIKTNLRLPAKEVTYLRYIMDSHFIPVSGIIRQAKKGFKVEVTIG